MKKVILTIITIVSVFQVHAQEKDTLAYQLSHIVDSLVIKVNKLQHENNFMSCELKLFDIDSNLQNSSNSVAISTNQIILDIYANNFDKRLYESYIGHYNSCVYEKESTIELFNVTKKYITLQLFLSNFWQAEIEVISERIKKIEAGINTLTISLRRYEAALEIYKNNL